MNHWDDIKSHSTNEANINDHEKIIYEPIKMSIKLDNV